MPKYTSQDLIDNLNYLMETKTLIKNALETPYNVFRDYANLIEKYVKNQVKSTAEGENIYITDSADLPIKLTIKGNTPTQETRSGEENLYNISSIGSQIGSCIILDGKNTDKLRVQAKAKDAYISQVVSSGSGYTSLVGNLIPCNYGENIYVKTGNVEFSNNYITEYDKDGTSLGFNYFGYYDGTYTPQNQNCKFLTIRIGHANAVVGGIYTLAPIISKSPITEFVPYGAMPSPDYPSEVQVVDGNYDIVKSNGKEGVEHQEQVYPLDTSEYPLYSENDYYYKSDDKWYVHNEFVRETIDGNSSQDIQYSGSFGALLYTNIKIANVNNTSTGNIWSNKAKEVAQSQLLNNNGICLNNTANRILIKFDGSTNYNTNKLARQFFMDNPYDVIYRLATPTETEITNPVLIEQLEALSKAFSYYEITNINSEGNTEVLPIIKAEYIVNVDETSSNNAAVNLEITETTTGRQSAIMNNITKLPPFKISISNADYLFSGFENLLECPNLDTSNVTSMNSMFMNSPKIKLIPLLNTSNVTSMEYTFANCTSLETILLLDTSNVTSMDGMCSQCTSLQTFPSLNTSKVTSMYRMFDGCSSLQTFPLLDTSNVTDMSYMFRDCNFLWSIPLLNTSKVTNMNYMFFNCASFLSIPLLDTSNVISMDGMFGKCVSLEEESLNNILAMCTNATSYTGTKNLVILGLNNRQITICKTLSNYNAFIEAGWTAE